MDVDNSSNKQWKTENANMYMDIVKLTVAESRTLSDTTKKEVLKWLSKVNFEESQGNSSCSRECVSSNGRKSGIRSGDSSLESNLEPPLKRIKLTEPSTVRQEKHSIELKKQPRIDQCFPKIDTLPSIENFPRTPVKNTENLISPRKDSYNDKTPDRKSTPVNSVPRKNIAEPKRRFVPKTPADIKNLGKSMNNNKENVSASNSAVNTVRASYIFQDMFDHENKDLQNSDQNNTVNRSLNTMENLNSTTLKNKVSLPVTVTEPRKKTTTVSPVPLQENILKTLPPVLNEEERYQKTIQGLVDSEYDTDDSIVEWADFNLEGILDSNESDSEEIIQLPVNTKVNMPVKSVLVEQNTSPCINVQPVRKDFLASLSNDVPLENANLRAASYRTNYSSLKEDLCKELYALYNEKVFDNKLPKDMLIEWSVRLQRAAGKYKCSKSLEKAPSSSRILLSTKILNSANRLRDVLIHEMCHAAARLIDNVRDGHGSFWKAWASKAVKVFPELPTITRCHSYQTEKKFTYRCTCCGHSFGRHRRSLDINRKICGYCHGPFEILIKNVTKAGRVQENCMSSTKQPKEFALYVKENFHTVRQRETSIKHGEVIQILKKQFSAIQITSKQTN